MKTMTCRQMGGPCDTAIQGNTVDEMINNGGAHIKEMAAKGDAEHIKVAEMMDEMQKNPESGKEWYAQFIQKFNALTEE